MLRRGNLRQGAASNKLGGMYIPSAFKIDDPEAIRAAVQDNPFAILISTVDGEPVATHLPILVGQEAGKDILFGHIAKANRHWQAFGTSSLLIFAGPHGYVSPSWYETRPNVPTWNYIAIHAYGTPQLVDDPAAMECHLREMVLTFDPELPTTHPESVSPETIHRLIPGIVMFRMPVDRWEAKAKLNQNRKEQDRLAVRARYLESEKPEERAMARMMRS